MFERERCDLCGDCLARCQYLNLDRAQAKEEMQKLIDGEDSLVLERCVTCFACEEYCPNGAHPFDLIAEEQERKSLPAIDPELAAHLIDLYEPQGQLRIKEIKEPVMSLCIFSKFPGLIDGDLFRDISFLKGRHFFCNLIYLHMGRNSVILQRAPKIVENVAKHLVSELICFHDECYGFFASYAPRYGIEVPFKPIHLFEHLYNYLNDHLSNVKKLGIKAAYQRPCSSRFTPEKEHFLDEIFEIIGVLRADRKYDREGALCCGAGILLAGNGDLVDEIQKKNIQDMVDSGAKMCVFTCPECYNTLAEKVRGRGLEPIMVSDLCRLALGERSQTQPGMDLAHLLDSMS